MDNQLFNYRAVVTGVYDGDSITIDIDLGFNNWMKNQKVRLFGINTPEIRGEERPDGLVARDRLRELILDKEIVITSYKDKSGKYGRWLATVFLKQDGMFENINTLLLAEGLAEVYGS
jgi:Micrococcal nuclease (thermonuclease) homologs